MHESIDFSDLKNGSRFETVYSSCCWVVFHFINIPYFASPLRIDRHLGCFQFLAMNAAAMNIQVQYSSLCGDVCLHFSRVTSRSGIVGSYGNFMFLRF